MTIIETPKQNNVSDSLVNIYEETKPSRAGSAIESSEGINVVCEDLDNSITKMSRKGNWIKASRKHSMGNSHVFSAYINKILFLTESVLIKY